MGTFLGLSYFEITYMCYLQGPASIYRLGTLKLIFPTVKCATISQKFSPLSLIFTEIQLFNLQTRCSLPLNPVEVCVRRHFSPAKTCFFRAISGSQVRYAACVSCLDMSLCLNMNPFPTMERKGGEDLQLFLSWSISYLKSTSLNTFENY